MTDVPANLVEAVRQERCSPEAAALHLARDFRPGLSIRQELARLDRLAEGLGPLPADHPPTLQAAALQAYLHERHGFRGDDADYYDPDNSYLDRVLDRRRGIPVTLAVLLAAVGRRVGCQVDLVGFPGHFLARVGGASGALVDPFAGFRPLSEVDLDRLAARFLGGSDRLDRHVHLAPVGLRPLVVRMLLNVKHTHERRGDHARAMIACDRLVDLTGAVTFRRDRGLHALALGAVEAALSDLTAYLEEEGRAPDADRVRRALARAREGVAPPS
ncbi:MAG: SirB1 family protein [Sandaracinaceae bacterium]